MCSLHIVNKKRKTEKRCNFAVKVADLFAPLSRLSHMQPGFQPGQLSLLCYLTKKEYGLSEKKSISTLKTFWKVAYEKSIPNPYEPVRDLPFPLNKLSLRIDSLPTEREMLASIPSLRAMNRDFLAVRNPWGVKG